MKSPSLSLSSKRHVDRLMGEMTIEEKIGQMIFPAIWKEKRLSREILSIPVGGFFAMGRSAKDLHKWTRQLNSRQRTPVMVCSDLENGAGPAIPGKKEFSRPMGMAATRSSGLVREAGRITGLEGRESGVHWTLGPVCDINMNPNNPVVNNRSFGDDPRLVAEMATAFVRGLQTDFNMAATAKHFPGDGVDDRDQHLCTSINSLSKKDWYRTFGRVWRSVFDAGVLSVMTGHIALPWQEGARDHRGPLPATLSRRIQDDLLRKEFGFEGRDYLDALPMVGYSAHVRKGEEGFAFFQAGGDVMLFSNPVADFRRLVEGFKNKEFTEKRLDQTVLCILQLKGILGLLDGDRKESTKPPVFDAARTAVKIADQSVTVVKNAGKILPLRLKKKARILTITIAYHLKWASWSGAPDFLVVDEELKSRGYRVDHLRNPTHNQILECVKKYDAVFLNVKTWPHGLMGTVRLTGHLAMTLWRAFWTENPNVVVTSFGNPYLIHEMPHVPVMVNLYSWTDEQQHAAVKVWLGEIKPRGKSPVRLERLQHALNI